MSRLSTLARRAFWPLLDKAARMLLGLLVGIVVARYLGPEQFGVLSFAMAWASFFGALAWLGLGDAVTRDVVREPRRRPTLLGAVVVLRFAGCLAAAAAALLLLPLAFPEQADRLLPLVAAVVAASLFSETAGAVTIWMMATGNTRYLALTRTLPFVLAQGLRVALVAGGAALIWFAAAVPIETMLVFIASWWLYRRVVREPLRLRFDRRLFRTMLGEGLPVLLAALLASLALRLDQLMLAKLADFRQVGLYAGAIRFSEVWWGLAPAVMQVAAPMLLFGNDDAASRRRYLQVLYGGLLLVAIAVAAAVSLCARPLVVQLLGPAFEGAEHVLVIHVWTAVFVFADALTYQELIRRGLQRVLMIKAGAVIVINAALNLWLIPAHGAAGAAAATLLSFALGPLIVLSLPATRDLLMLQLQGVPTFVEETRARLRRRRTAGGHANSAGDR